MKSVLTSSLELILSGYARFPSSHQTFAVGQVTSYWFSAAEICQQADRDTLNLSDSTSSLIESDL